MTGQPMLLTRVLTALILLPLVVGGILFLPTAAVAVVAAGVLLIGAWEWGLLLRFAGIAARLVYAAAVAAALAYMFRSVGDARLVSGLFAAALVWWLSAVFWIRAFPRYWEATLGRRPVAALLGVLVLAATLLALIRVHAREEGPILLLLLFVLIWVADTGAYFAGRIRGRHKLAQRVSPGKTWEGAAGGIVLATAAAAAGGWWLGDTGGALAGWLVLGAAVATISIVGDLTISMFKRRAGVKDSGSIFPGHGGVLDRLDSLFAAAPVYAVGLAFLLD